MRGPPFKTVTIDPLSHTLGRIEESLNIITKTQAEDRVASAVYRTQMRNDLTAVRDTVFDLRSRVNNNADELAEMRPDVKDFRITKEQGIGAWNTVKTLWTVLITLGAGFVGLIVHIFWPSAK